MTFREVMEMIGDFSEKKKKNVSCSRGHSGRISRIRKEQELELQKVCKKPYNNELWGMRNDRSQGLFV